MSISTPNFTKWGPRYGLEIQIQDGARRHLEFYQKRDVRSSNPRRASVILPTKFDANIFTGDRDMDEKPYPKW